MDYMPMLDAHFGGPSFEDAPNAMTVYSRIVEKIDGTACEIEYTDQHGNIVGYWAYGSFDPEYPYRGELQFTVVDRNT